MQKYIITGKNSQETAASMLNKPQNRREIVEPLGKSFNAEFIEFLYLNSPDFDFMCVITGKEDKDIAAANLIMQVEVFLRLIGLGLLKHRNGKKFLKLDLIKWLIMFLQNKHHRNKNVRKKYKFYTSSSIFMGCS